VQIVVILALHLSGTKPTLFSLQPASNDHAQCCHLVIYQFKSWYADIGVVSVQRYRFEP